MCASIHVYIFIYLCIIEPVTEDDFYENLIHVSSLIKKVLLLFLVGRVDCTPHGMKISGECMYIHVYVHVLSGVCKTWTLDWTGLDWTGLGSTIIFATSLIMHDRCGRWLTGFMHPTSLLH